MRSIFSESTRSLAAVALVAAVAAVLTLGATACGGDAAPQDAAVTSSPSASASPDGERPPLICGTANPPTAPATPLPGSEPIFITDRMGEDWDISTAVRKYGYERDRFDYGLGLFVIRPIIDPGVARPGDPAYPRPDDGMPVIGITVRGEARAYPVAPMSSHEVANDTIAGVHLAATW